MQAIELLAERTFQLVHEGNQNILKQILYLPGLIATGGLHGTRDGFKRRFEAVLDCTAHLVGQQLPRVAVRRRQGICQFEAFTDLGINQVL